MSLISAFETIARCFLITAVATVSGVGWSAEKPLSGYPLYVMDPAVRRMAGTVEEKLETIRQLGYGGVSSNDATVDGIRRVIRGAESRGMKVHALYLACPVTTGGIELPRHFTQICETVAGHDTLIWLYMDDEAYNPSDEQGDMVAVPALQAAADLAAGHKVRVALYPHRDNWVETFADAIRVADKVDRPNFGVSFNLCHSLYAGEEEQIPELLRQAAPRLFMVTVNGADSGAPKSGWDRLIRPIGQGSYDLAPLLKLLRELNYTEPIGFQSFGIKMNPVECLRISMTEWRKLNRD